jgi:hypothetical protein
VVRAHQGLHEQQREAELGVGSTGLESHGDVGVLKEKNDQKMKEIKM